MAIASQTLHLHSTPIPTLFRPSFDFRMYLYLHLRSSSDRNLNLHPRLNIDDNLLHNLRRRIQTIDS